MIDDLLQSVEQLRSDAQHARRQGRSAKSAEERDRLFGDAKDGFSDAIKRLERGLRITRRRETGYTPDVCRILESLSQTYGSLGGTCRDSGDMSEAIKKYDLGNDIETERRNNCKAQDTYNMLQRLIVRLLVNPNLLEVDSEFRAEIESVRSVIEKQIEGGRDDSWALADLAVSRFLCGATADKAVADLEHRKIEGSFYESTYTAIRSLIDEGLGNGGQLGERLDDFQRMLQRRGGIR